MAKKVPLTIALLAADLLQGKVAALDGVISKAEALTGYGLDAMVVGSFMVDVASAAAPDTVGRRARALKAKYGLK
jgi:hypothetical protein